MLNKTTKQVPAQSTRRTSTPKPQSNKATQELPRTPASKSRKHAALKGSPTVTVSLEQWDNINRAIMQTVDLILAKDITLDGFGPNYWEMDEGLGIALIAEIRRAIKETCTLSNPRLKREIRKMACDVTHEEFRFPYKGGGVWFRFKMTDFQKAIKPIVSQELDVSPFVDKNHHDPVENKQESGANKADGIT